MTRPASYNRVWAGSAASDQMGGESTTDDQTVIRDGWIGTATASPPTARMQNYWQIRVDLGLQEIERQGFLSWRSDVAYQIGVVVSYAGYLFQAFSANTGITPQGSSDIGIWSLIQPGKWPTTTDNITGTLSVTKGGTGGTTQATARAGIAAAASGANSDITSISGLTTALSVSQGGTGATTPGVARTNLGLGNSATYNVQSSPYDGTLGAICTVGAFGWGSTYNVQPLLLADMTGSQAAYSGLYRYQSSTIGKPSFGSGFGSLVHASVTNDTGGNYATQLVIDYAADAIGFRRLSGSAGWQSFRQIWHDGNLTTATESTQGIAKVATQTLTNAGVDDTTMVTPKKLIAWFAATFASATTTVSGLIKIATDALIAAGTDATTAVTPLGLKNKSQASAYDVTASKLLSTGSFGMGSTYAAGPLYVSDANGSLITGSGLYRYDSSTNGKPTFGSGFGSLLHSSLTFDGGGNYATQLGIDYAANSIGFRRLSGSGGWQPWYEIYTKANLVQATTAALGIVQLGAASDVLAGTSTTLVPSIAALVSGLLGAGGRSTTDYMVIPYVDKSTGARKNKILQWTTTPALANNTYWTWTYPVALTVGVQTMGGMMIGATSGTLEVASGAGLTSAQFANGTSGSNANPAFVFIIGE